MLTSFATGRAPISRAISSSIVSPSRTARRVTSAAQQHANAANPGGISSSPEPPFWRNGVFGTIIAAAVTSAAVFCTTGAADAAASGHREEMPPLGALSVKALPEFNAKFAKKVGSAEAVAEVDKVPPLPYDYGALEPYIDQKTMELHHDKHHATYVAKLTGALKKAPEPVRRANLVEVVEMVGTSALPQDVQTVVRNNGGGHWNHSFFWKVMAPKGEATEFAKAASPELKDAIKQKFGSFENFRDKFGDAAAGVFGSGWAWLVLDDASGDVLITTTANQDTPLMKNLVRQPGYPLLGLDVWEHDWFSVVNWKQVSENFKLAKEGQVAPTR